ncbi:MAG: hypothetical protein H6559_36385 [Lewinellaceae bacterium]|nr:hypothetical protein [Lewinellaceae bacterium]
MKSATSKQALATALSKLALLACLALFTASCMTTKTVGNFQAIQGEEYTYAKGKQVWLFWGLLPAGRTNVNTPSDGDCEVVTRFNFGDFLITTITAGIVTTYSIKVRAKRKG